MIEHIKTNRKQNLGDKLSEYYFIKTALSSADGRHGQTNSPVRAHRRSTRVQHYRGSVLTVHTHGKTLKKTTNKQIKLRQNAMPSFSDMEIMDECEEIWTDSTTFNAG